MPAFISRYIHRRDQTAKQVPERVISKAMCWQHLQQFGESAVAFPVMTDPELQTFGDARGMIVYARKMGFVYVLGDPLASEQDSKELLDEFIDTFGDPVLVACNKQTAELATKRGYLVNHLGHDSVLDLNTFDFAGGEKKRLRYSESWFQRSGATVTEDPNHDIDTDEIRKVSQAWQGSRVASREIAFLNKTLCISPPPSARRFYAISKTGSVLGFIEFDPKYRGGQLVGYLASTKRRLPQDTAYLDLAIMAHVIRTFQQEGIAELDLGLSPLSNIASPNFGVESRWLRHAFQMAFKAKWVNSSYFNFQGLAEYKERFRGNHRPRYICIPKRGSNLMRLAGFLILTKIV